MVRNYFYRRRLIVLLVLGCGGAFAAQTIYKSPGSSGPVYSDSPTPQGRPVELPPPNIAQPPRKPAPETKDTEPGKAAAQPQAERYRSFRITRPEDMGSAAANTATFEVRVAVEPALQTKFGHAFTVKLNGKPVPRRYTFTEMMTPPEFFGDTIEVNQRFKLEASIVDRDGNVVMTAKKAERGVSFEAVVLAVETGGLLDVLQHPNIGKYPNQQVFVVALNSYACLVPFVEEEDYFFPKTIIPSRKATRDYLKQGGTDEEA